MTGNQTLLYERDGRGVITLTLNRPARRNALDGMLMQALCDRLGELEADPACRILVLTGAGPAFCAGADFAWLEQVVEGGDESNLADAELLAQMMWRLHCFPRPTIALVNGPAYGGGAGMVACCDLALAVEDAGFAFSEVRLGLVAAVIAPYVIQAIGPRNARRLMLTGEPFGPQQALDMGLVTEVVQAGGEDVVLERDIAHLLAGSALAQGETKEMLRHYQDQVDGQLDYSARLTSRVRASEDALGRMRQFLQQKGRR
jgi:methylglutaconyl-CoA hydratase